MKRWVGRIAATGLAVLTAACGQIRVVDQGEPAKDEGPPTVHIDPCSIVEREEMATAIGLPLDVERTQIWNDWYYCEWLGGGTPEVVMHRPSAWAEFEVSRHPSSPKALRADMGKETEEVPDLGAYAYWWACDCGAGGLEVVTPAGALLHLRWDVPPEAVTPEFRTRMIGLGRAAVARVDPVYPGDAASLVAKSVPAINPCRAISDVHMLRVLGFTGGQAQRDYIGGPLGGHWYCERVYRDGSDQFHSLGVSVMKAQSAVRDVPNLGAPVPELGREAGASFAPPVREGTRIVEPAAIAFLGPEAHVVVLTYSSADGRDDAWHRGALTDLARAFGKT